MGAAAAMRSSDVQELRRGADEADGPQMRARMRLVA
jgi:hypothetical protein